MTTFRKSPGTQSHPLLLVAAALVLVATAACGPTGSGVVDTAGGNELATTFQRFCLSYQFAPARGRVALTAQNGLAPNGMCQNGLASVGLVPASPTGAAFAAWFNQDERTSEILMPYLYSCAAPGWYVFNWTNPATNVSYRWPGGLGLAPGWASGNTATVPEQQAVSACLAARINKYGEHVSIALEGRTAGGSRIPVGANELETYSEREGCFFGNLFDGDGVFVGLDHPSWDAATSSLRACAADARFDGSSTQCPPLFQVGACAELCTRDSTNTFYESCTWNGKTYSRPLATRLRPADLYHCGDGVCQLTERCGDGAEAASCAADCGACP